MDVLDLDWSAKGLLASASVDNKILLWDILSSSNGNSKILSPMQQLVAHTSFVKGISFDPVGRYLISSAADNIVIVWDGDNGWNPLQRLDQPLKNSLDMTMFRRASWSPDGRSVCVSAATKSSRPVGMVLRRGDWQDVADLVGHQVATVSARFCPHLLKHASGSQSDGVACLVAVGDQNGVMTIWSTERERPLYALRNLFSEAITDITWMHYQNKVGLACCSISGHVIILDLQEECGQVLQDEDISKHFQSLYGKGLKELHAKDEALVSNPLILKYSRAASGDTDTNESRETNKTTVIQPVFAPVPVGAAAAIPSSSIATAPMPTGVQILQQQSVTNKNGKKRIRPVLMQAEGMEMTANDFDKFPSVAPFDDAAATVIMTTTASHAQKGEKKRIRFQSDDVSSNKTASNLQQLQARLSTTPSSSSSSSSSFGFETTSSSTSPRSVIVQQQVLNIKLTKKEMIFSIPLPIVDCDGSVITVPMLEVDPTSSTHNGNSKGKQVKAQRLTKPAGFQQLSRSGTNLSKLSLEDVSSSSSRNSAGQELWSVVIAGEVSCVKAICLVTSDDATQTKPASHSMVVAGCTDGSLHIVDGDNGLRFCSPFILGASVVFIDVQPIKCGDQFHRFRITSLTGDGTVYLWDYSLATHELCSVAKSDIKAVVLSLQCRDRVTSSVSSTNNEQAVDFKIEDFILHRHTHMPVLHVRCPGAAGGDFQIFQYHSMTACWQRIADSRHFLSR